MQNVKAELLALINNIEEKDFDLSEFKETLQEIDEQFEEVDIYNSFCNILEVSEATGYDFDDDTTEFINEIQSSAYVDIENLSELNFEDIKDRLELITNIL